MHLVVHIESVPGSAGAMWAGRQALCGQAGRHVKALPAPATHLDLTQIHAELMTEGATIHMIAANSATHPPTHAGTHSCRSLAMVDTHPSTHPPIHALTHSCRASFRCTHGFRIGRGGGRGPFPQDLTPPKLGPRTCNPPCPHLADALLPLVVADALDARDQRGGQRVDGKAHIVGLHRAVLPVMVPLVRILHAHPGQPLPLSMDTMEGYATTLYKGYRHYVWLDAFHHHD